MRDSVWLLTHWPLYFHICDEGQIAERAGVVVIFGRFPLVVGCTGTMDMGTRCRVEQRCTVLQKRVREASFKNNTQRATHLFSKSIRAGSGFSAVSPVAGGRRPSSNEFQ